VGPRKVNPEEWEKDIEKVEHRLMERRVGERRRRDRWGRYLERAALLAMVVIMVVGWTRYDEQQDSISAQQKQLKAHDNRLSESRGAVTSVLCGSLNDIQTILRRMIVDGAQGSALFEDIYREHGAPPLHKRVADARKQASALENLDCTALKQAVEETLVPPPPKIKGG
jgi:type VI protein secretion system component VasK